MKRSFNWFKELSVLKQIGFGLVVIVALAMGANNASHPKNITVTNAAKLTQSQSAQNKPPAEATKTADVTTKTETTTQSIPFSSTTVSDPTLAQGQSKLTTAGVDGTQTITYSVTYTNGIQSSKVQTDTQTTTPPITQVTSIGTYVKPVAVQPTPTPAPTATPSSNCDPNYTPCIPYVAGNGLNCADIKIEVHVVGVDHNKFDADGDGYGCESYR